MGAGRKTETYTLCHDQYPGYYELPARKLAKDKLGVVIFGCTHSTMNECISKQFFGLPAPHYDYVRNVKPGIPLFLFNYNDGNLYGIFEATSHGQMNIDPNGWTAHGSGRTLYPAQVWVCVRQECQPPIESQYKPIIAANYSSSQHFMFELDHAQTGKLLALLTPLAIPQGQPKTEVRIFHHVVQYRKLDCVSHPLHNKSQNIPHPQDVIDSRAGIAYTQLDQKNGERLCDSSARCAESTFYPWVINGVK